MLERILAGKQNCWRMECPNCDEGCFTSYTRRPEFVCTTCGMNFSPSSREPLKIRHLANGLRRYLSESTKTKIRDRQQDMCHWCGASIGQQMLISGRLVTLQPRFDHVDPYCVCMDNEDENFVMCCQKCNGWKSSIWFDSELECQKYLLRKWNRLDIVLLEDNI